MASDNEMIFQLLQELNKTMNSRFDSIFGRLSEIEKNVITEEEHERDIRDLMIMISKLTEHNHEILLALNDLKNKTDNIFPKDVLETILDTITKRITVLEQQRSVNANNKREWKQNLKIAIIGALVGSATLVAGEVVFHNVYNPSQVVPSHITKP